MMFTVLGARGFIGSHLVKHFEESGTAYFAPERDDNSLYTRHLGHVIYCIGLTADFRERPFETVKAHVCKLLSTIENAEFNSFLYLSSTRVYNGVENTQEDTNLQVNPLNMSDLYNISKLMGESVCFASKKHRVRVVRLSNVYGKDYSSSNFITAVIKEALGKKIVLRSSMSSSKDYIDVDDVVSALTQIAVEGKHQIYNVASGVNVSNQWVTKILQEVTGCTVEVDKNAATIIFPEICIERIQEEFQFRARDIGDSLKKLVRLYEEAK